MYRQHQEASVGPDQQYQLSASHPSYNYSPFQASFGRLPDNTALQGSPQQALPASRVARTQHPSHARQSSLGWETQRGQAGGSPSPHFNTAAPARDVASALVPTDRALPPREVTAETIVDAYVSFILYCNPKFHLDVDTSTLRANLQSPPKSDNKDFAIYRLFELIQKFDAKEIKTWGQLALDLGVEAPDVSKGQSVQKVQQYSVRLKRWMRAMHVDAFFEYLLGKQHAYFSKIPHPDDPYPDSGRDGVLAEEDLAIRALDPTLRPKRGRRRNSEAEQEEIVEVGVPSSQPAYPIQGGQTPANAMPINPLSLGSHGHDDPWDVASSVTPQTFAPWMRRPDAPQSAITTSAPMHLRWQLHDDLQNSATPHPMTALPTSMAAHIEAAFDNEPKSAILPSARKRRKHGPAVSSAWSSTLTPGAKPRGRPPVGRSVHDGPFSTFPADPANERMQLSTTAPSTASVEKQHMAEEHPKPQMRPAIVSRQSDGVGRPGLSLQVPKHSGGPVRLATPPRLMVTGETSESEQSTIDHGRRANISQKNPPRPTDLFERELPGFAFEALKRVLASDLLRAELNGRRRRLSGDEAKRLADAALERLNVPRADTESARDDVARLTAASWLGVGGQLNVPLGPAMGQTKRITVTQFRVDADGYEEIVPEYDEPKGVTREVFDVSWNATMGGCNGFFELKGLSVVGPLKEADDAHDIILDSWQETARNLGLDEERIRNAKQNLLDPNYGFRTQPAFDASSEEFVDWKSRYRALEFGTRMAKGEFDRFRQLLIERVLDTLI